MSSLALMRFLESAPGRYDAGMRALTLGRIGRIHEALAAAVPPGDVLEIGCGTGSLTARLVERGARVTAIDQSPVMLERARARVGEAAVFVETTASEIDALPGRAFDAVAASLCLSEMSARERAFVLEQAHRRLRAGGVLAVADEVVPAGAVLRALHAALRLPQALLGWLLAGSVSRPLADLRGEIEAAGFAVRSETRWLAGALALVVAERAP